MIHKVAWRYRARVVLGAGALLGCSVYQTELLTSGAATSGAAGAVVSGGGSGGSGALPATSSAGSGASSAGDDGGKSQTNAGSGGGGSAGGGGNGGDTHGGGGNGGSADPSPGGSSGGGAAGAMGAPAPVLELIDDMEDGDAFVKATAGRNGHWDVSHDSTASATQTPAPASFMMTALADAARPSSYFAAYTQGAGFKDWGAFLTVSMRSWPVYDDTPVYDASKYSGISFVAKVGAGSDTALRVRFVGGQTDPRGKQCTVGGGIDTACFDHFFTTVTLTNDFARYDVYFADFVQAGVGKAYASLDVSKMYALELFFPARAGGNAFELWVDELSFILAAPAK